MLRYTGMPLPAGALRGTSDPRPVADPTKHRSHAEIASDTAAGDEASATVMSLPGSRPMDGLSAVNPRTEAAAVLQPHSYEQHAASIVSHGPPSHPQPGINDRPPASQRRHSI